MIRYVITSRLDWGLDREPYETQTILCKEHFEKEVAESPLIERESVMQTDAHLPCDHCPRSVEHA